MVIIRLYELAISSSMPGSLALNTSAVKIVLPRAACGPVLKLNIMMSS